jgi:integrase
MGHSEYDPAAKDRRLWNVGRMVGAKRALKPQQVWAIRFWLDRERRLRHRAMFDFAIDSKLRGCDVVKVKIGDLVSGGRVRSRAIVVQQKTGRPVQFELLEPTRGSILAWLEHRGGTLDEFVFPSRIDHADHISTRQYARLVDEWVTGIGLRPQDYGPIRCAEPRRPSSISRQGTCALCRSCSAPRRDREHRSLSGRRRRGRARPR